MNDSLQEKAGTISDINKRKLKFKIIVISATLISILGAFIFFVNLNDCSNITYSEIMNILKKNEEPTIKVKWAAQFEKYFGKKVSWSGWVANVSKRKDFYEVLIDMDSPEVVISIQDVKLYTKDKKVLKLKDKQHVFFEGRIKDIEGFFNKYWIELDHGKIL
jgi:hypothetical protein